MASRDLDRSRGARAEAAAMLERVEGMNQGLGAACARSPIAATHRRLRRRSRAFVAVRGHRHAGARRRDGAPERLGTIHREATALQELLHRPARTMANASRRCPGCCSASPSSAANGNALRTSRWCSSRWTAGSVELFLA
jgi:hypothetical protein